MNTLLISTAALACTLAAPLQAAPPKPFTAHYQLSKQGKPLGETVMRMRREGDAWLFTTDSQATHGMAGFLGLTISEATHLRIHEGRPEVVTYDYHLDAAFMDDRKSVKVDWDNKRTTVIREDDTWHYDAVAGMVDKHMLPWFLGRELAQRPDKFEITVAVRDRASTQHYLLSGTEAVTVPLGTMQAVRMDRNDPGRNFIAWYVPERYPVPVQLTHDEYSLQLVSFSRPAKQPLAAAKAEDGTHKAGRPAAASTRPAAAATAPAVTQLRHPSPPVTSKARPAPAASAGAAADAGLEKPR